MVRVVRRIRGEKKITVDATVQIFQICTVQISTQSNIYTTPVASLVLLKYLFLLKFPGTQVVKLIFLDSNIIVGLIIG